MVIKDLSGWTLEIHDGEEYLIFMFSKDDDGHRFIITDEVAEKIVHALNCSERVNGYWISTKPSPLSEFI